MLTVKNLTKRYRGVTACDKVSLTLPEQEVVAFIGPNGAGKSTVLNMIARLLAKDEGEVIIDGIPLEQWDNNELAKTIAVLSQVNTVQSKITVRELIAFGRFPYSHGRLTMEDEAKINEALSFMELDDRADHFLDELSGGQRQRALIAMILAQDTKYVFLDEPTNNLDIYHAVRLMKAVRTLCDKFGKTVVMVLHEINFASFYADTICAFKQGRLIKAAPSQEIMQADFLKELYQVDFSIINEQGKTLALYY